MIGYVTFNAAGLIIAILNIIVVIAINEYVSSPSSPRQLYSLTSVFSSLPLLFRFSFSALTRRSLVSSSPESSHRPFSSPRFCSAACACSLPWQVRVRAGVPARARAKQGRGRIVKHLSGWWPPSQATAKNETRKVEGGGNTLQDNTSWVENESTK